MRKKLWLLLAAALPLLCGCMMSASVDDLYALPQLPEEYESLSARLSEILALGAEYAAPQAGANLPPVQMVDLDGDGTDEALGFFRISSEERPLKIYVFRAVEDDYQQAAVIDGSGTSIHSIPPAEATAFFSYTARLLSRSTDSIPLHFITKPRFWVAFFPSYRAPGIFGRALSSARPKQTMVRPLSRGSTTSASARARFRENRYTIPDAIR